MSSFVVALDVGGTSMKGGLVSESGAVLLSERCPTPRSEGPEAVVAAIREFISHLAASGDGDAHRSGSRSAGHEDVALLSETLDAGGHA